MTRLTVVAGSLATILISPPGAHAARPLITGDARVVDAGACQLEPRTGGDTSVECWALSSRSPIGNREATAGLVARPRERGDTPSARPA